MPSKSNTADQIFRSEPEVESGKAPFVLVRVMLDVSVTSGFLFEP